MTARSAEFAGGLQRMMPATPQERGAALWSFAYFFTLLAGYYTLRPLRDQMGIDGGVKNLPWLFTATFVTLLVAQPIYGALVARLPRIRFIPIVYHFFVVNLALFWLLLTFDIQGVIVARVFFVWVSVFSLFAVAVFWSFMADLFTPEQGKRLFGFIGAGGTAGGLLGPVITIGLSKPIGSVNLLIVAAVFLELAVFCVHRIERTADRPMQATPQQQRMGGSAFAGLSDLIRSPYLLGVAGWISLLSFGATIVYLALENTVAATIHDHAARTRLFASIDLAVNLLSLATQVFVTASLLKRWGTGIAAAALPVAYVAGFAALAIASTFTAVVTFHLGGFMTLVVTPTLAVVVTLQVVQRWMNFALANPARQLFFTVVGREEKYKVKNMIDVVFYRGSDALYGWVYDSLRVLGLKLGVIALCALPVAAVWAVLSTALGRAQERRAAQVNPTNHQETPKGSSE